MSRAFWRTFSRKTTEMRNARCQYKYVLPYYSEIHVNWAISRWTMPVPHRVYDGVFSLFYCILSLAILLLFACSFRHLGEFICFVKRRWASNITTTASAPQHTQTHRNTQNETEKNGDISYRFLFRNLARCSYIITLNGPSGGRNSRAVCIYR